MSKTLEEFITEKAKKMYQQFESGIGLPLSGSCVLEAVADITAAEILRFAEGKAQLGFWFNTETKENESAELVRLSDLRTYITGKTK